MCFVKREAYLVKREAYLVKREAGDSVVRIQHANGE